MLSPPSPANAMTQALRRYLDLHGDAVDATSLDIARRLANPDDTDRDARTLISNARSALHQAIEAALDTGPVEGWRYGSAGVVCVAVRVPLDGQGNMGKIGVSVARLDTAGMIPCPDEWPQKFPPPPELVTQLHQMFQTLLLPPGGPRIVAADAEGRVQFESGKSGSAYVVEELADGEIWLRPLDVAEATQ